MFCRCESGAVSFRHATVAITRRRCGGSEIHQLAAMLGLPKRLSVSTIVEEIIPAVARSLRPDVPYVLNSPFGGATGRS
ncbi:beta-mannosidase (plasmid) [Rhizobium grahamii CCGE 502]|uniref:Beta-mannosidase n=1 Tax=Rhizobium grahamii CCGE 502 TaxID=990285 RepID=S3HJA7_9HYPH|nr:beta-mannosidase [Rhizobium grahamii CCGE 502]